MRKWPFERSKARLRSFGRFLGQYFLFGTILYLDLRFDFVFSQPEPYVSAHERAASEQARSCHRRWALGEGSGDRSRRK